MQPPEIRKRNIKQKTDNLLGIRKAIQVLAFTAFVITLFLTRQDGLSPAYSSLLAKLSPLTMFSSMISSRTFLTGATISIILFLSSLVVGRAWCGWLCPLGSILDVFKPKQKSRHSKIPEKARSIKYVLLVMILVAAVFSNLTLLIFDPITLLIRTLTITVFPVLDRLISSLERLLINIPFLSDFVFRFDGLIRPAILPVEPAVFQYGALIGLFFILIVALNIFAERFWCRYLCPLGALLGISSRISIFKRRISKSCAECGLCEVHCPTGTIDPENGFKSDPAECTLCLQCQPKCLKESTTFRPGLDLAPSRVYDLKKRTLLRTFGVSLLAVGLFALDRIKRFSSDHLIRPPGSNIIQFPSQCIRCGLCIQVCPTHALQSDLDESGASGVSTPILVPRLGFCQYSCNLCGQVCPVGAIPALSLEEKRNAVIGRAYIDENRCIAWSDHQTCIVCEEMCPLPEKAIKLEIGEFMNAEGELVTIQLPIVNRDACIGCGTCEYKCPVVGEAAIRVYTA